VHHRGGRPALRDRQRLHANHPSERNSRSRSDASATHLDANPQPPPRPLSNCLQRAGPPRASDGWHGLVGAEGRTAMTLIPQTSEPVSEDIGDSSSHRSPVCGDSEPLSFDEYVATRAAALVRFTMLLTGDLHRAEDLVQE